jgi:hypothetical protein
LHQLLFHFYCLLSPQIKNFFLPFFCLLFYLFINCTDGHYYADLLGAGFYDCYYYKFPWTWFWDDVKLLGDNFYFPKFLLIFLGVIGTFVSLRGIVPHYWDLIMLYILFNVLQIMRLSTLTTGNLRFSGIHLRGLHWFLSYFFR